MKPTPPRLRFGRTLIVIPARMASTRLPGKVLASLGGIAMVEWCRRAALAAGLGPVIVAADDDRIIRALEPFGADVRLTPRSCPSGSDRVWKIARARQWRNCRFILNVQGDEPFIRPETLRRTLEALKRRPWADMATAVTPIYDPNDAKNPNVVKAAMGANGRCLYFSRAPVPFPRDKIRMNGKGLGYYRHLGIYAYRTRALRRFISLPASSLERRERLEQLRALEAGMTIAAAIVDDSSMSIDTPQDLLRARRVLLARSLRPYRLQGLHAGRYLIARSLRPYAPSPRRALHG